MLGIAWLLAMVFLFVSVVLLLLYRQAITDRNAITNYVYLLLLKPEAYGKERIDFQRRLSHITARNKEELSSDLQYGLPDYAAFATRDVKAENADLLWEMSRRRSGIQVSGRSERGGSSSGAATGLSL